MSFGDHLDFVDENHDYSGCGWCNGKTKTYSYKNKNLSLRVGFLTMIGCVILWAILFG